MRITLDDAGEVAVDATDVLHGMTLVLQLAVNGLVEATGRTEEEVIWAIRANLDELVDDDDP